MVISRLAQILGDERHLQGRERAQMRVIAEGVLIEMETCLRELLLEGKAVYFDELGIFSLGIENKRWGVQNPYEFNAGKNIEAVHMNLYLGKRFRAKQLLEDAVFVESKMYEVDSSKPKENAATGD